jgi:hypothetical protein
MLVAGVSHVAVTSYTELDHLAEISGFHDGEYESSEMLRRVVW